MARKYRTTARGRRKARKPLRRKTKRFRSYRTKKSFERALIKRALYSRPRPVPQCTHVKLALYDHRTIDVGAVATGNEGPSIFPLLYRGNNAYDSLDLVGGDQPRGFGFWAGIYRRYCVLSSKITLTPINKQNNALVVIVGATTNNSTAGQDLETYMEQPLFKKLYIGDHGDGAKIKSLSMKMSTRRMFCIKNPDLDEEYSALVSSNPARQWYWHIGAAAIDTETGTPNDIKVQVKIEFLIKFYDPSYYTQES